MKSPTIRNLLEHSNIEWPVWKVMFYPLEIGVLLSPFVRFEYLLCSDRISLNNYLS